MEIWGISNRTFIAHFRWIPGLACGLHSHLAWAGGPEPVPSHSLLIINNTPDLLSRNHPGVLLVVLPGFAGREHLAGHLWGGGAAWRHGVRAGRHYVTFAHHQCHLGHFVCQVGIPCVLSTFVVGLQFKSVIFCLCSILKGANRIACSCEDVSKHSSPASVGS